MEQLSLLGDRLGFVSATKLAEFLQVQDTTLQQWKKIGRGPKRMRIGNAQLYAFENVKQWLNAQFLGDHAVVDLDIARVAGELD